MSKSPENEANGCNEDRLMLQNTINSINLREYKKDPTSPEKLTLFMRYFWLQKSRLIGKEFQVSDFPLTAKEIKERAERENPEMPIFVPEELTMQDLGKMFPPTNRNWSTRENSPLRNRTNNSGWLWIEASVDAPGRYSSEKQAKEYFEKERENGQVLRTYIVGSQISKLLVNKYFDEGITFSKLLNSYILDMGGVIEAAFGPSGKLISNVHLNASWSHESEVGFRSEEVIKP